MSLRHFISGQRNRPSLISSKTIIHNIPRPIDGTVRYNPIFHDGQSFAPTYDSTIQGVDDYLRDPTFLIIKNRCDSQIMKPIYDPFIDYTYGGSRPHRLNPTNHIPRWYVYNPAIKKHVPRGQGQWLPLTENPELNQLKTMQLFPYFLPDLTATNNKTSLLLETTATQSIRQSIDDYVQSNDELIREPVSRVVVNDPSKSPVYEADEGEEDAVEGTTSSC